MRVNSALLVAASLLAACAAPEETGPLGEAASSTSETAETGGGPAEALDETARASMRFELGTHYDRLTPVQPTGAGPDRVAVTAVFAYDCGACYEIDPLLSDWSTSAPGYVVFRRLPSAAGAVRALHARAYYALSVLGRAEALHAALFAEIHENGNPLDSREALVDFVGRRGIEPDAFAAAFDSFEVHALVERAAELNRRYRVASVPTVVVNGKYMTTPERAGGGATLIEIVRDLAAAENTIDD